ncbi:DMT family transporter [Bacillus horti]|uniref:Small multidrug resistance pump n=1 Tax=Caldalkalibacillus horti TaxID=77523 RepID=A0ABT9VUS5_9BACI|nr:SMR family transporter [Bacillus horti]MDQ0164630.1 small multidrug resistance pump [Bacillus horti]
MAYLYLLTAIFLEIIAALAARFSEGFTAPFPTIITIVFAVSSYFTFSLSLKNGMTIGVGYAIWSGVGVLSVALIGVQFLGDTLTLIQISGIILIIIGIVAIQVETATPET